MRGWRVVLRGWVEGGGGDGDGEEGRGDVGYAFRL